MNTTNYKFNNKTVYADFSFNPFQKKNIVTGFYTKELSDSGNVFYTLINASDKRNFTGSLGLEGVCEL